LIFTRSVSREKVPIIPRGVFERGVLHPERGYSFRDNKKENMKTTITNLTRISLSTIIAVAIGFAVAAPTKSLAGDTAKGGQKMLELSNTAVTPNADSLNAANQPAMSCPKCGDVVKTSSTAAGKGAFVKTTTYTQHLCESCKTTIETVGHGKARTDRAVHTCSDAGNTSACAMK
jgi:hypothetical protein